MKAALIISCGGTAAAIIQTAGESRLAGAVMLAANLFVVVLALSTYIHRRVVLRRVRAMWGARADEPVTRHRVTFMRESLDSIV